MSIKDIFTKPMETYLKFLNDPNPPTHLAEDELWEYYGGDCYGDISYYAFLLCRFGEASNWTTAMIMADKWSDWYRQNKSLTEEMSGYDSLLHWLNVEYVELYYKQNG